MTASPAVRKSRAYGPSASEPKASASAQRASAVAIADHVAAEFAIPGESYVAPSCSTTSENAARTSSSSVPSVAHAATLNEV